MVNIFNYFARRRIIRPTLSFMKKLQLVELGIIATVLIIGYKMITSLLTLIDKPAIWFWYWDRSKRNDGNFTNRSVLCILYDHFFCSWQEILTPLARFICRESEESLEFKLNKVAVLHVIIIAVCLELFFANYSMTLSNTY